MVKQLGRMVISGMNGKFPMQASAWRQIPDLGIEPSFFPDMGR
jgi:hypothetical protein